MKSKIKAIVISTMAVIFLITVVSVAISFKDEIKYILELKNTNVLDDVVGDIVEQPEPKIDVEHINEKLENISSLQTAKITYGCMVDFKEGTVPIITQNAFSMYYEATAYAAIEVSEIVCEEKDGKFILTLPEATIQDPNINPDSLEFYDVKNALLNKSELGDAATALQYAKKDFYYQKTTYQLLDMADKNAVDVLTNLLLCFLDDGEFEIVSAPKSENVMINPPMASTDKVKVNYVELKKLYEKAGFTEITLKPIEDVKIGLFTKDGEVESVTIDGKDTFKKTTVFNAGSEVIITYHTKEKK